MIMYQLAQKLGFDKELIAKTQAGGRQGRHDGARGRVDILREINRGMLDHRLHRPDARSG